MTVGLYLRERRTFSAMDTILTAVAIGTILLIGVGSVYYLLNAR